jgi:hypothetical protein
LSSREGVMQLKPGDLVWIPCEVKPGPFANERLVRIKTLGPPWIGFVDIQFLKAPVVKGETDIQGKLLEVSKGHITIALPGQPVESTKLRIIDTQDADKVPLVPVTA